MDNEHDTERSSRWRWCVWGMAAVAVLATCGLADAGPPPANNDPPNPLPKPMVEAWKKAGAEVGWMGGTRVGYVNFLSFLIEEEAAQRRAV